MNPYVILGVPLDADDSRIRRAYLEAIKEATPESNPERFKALAAAYDQIKDETSRLRYELFNTDCDAHSPLDAFLKHAATAPPPQPLSWENMKEFLRLCSKT